MLASDRRWLLKKQITIRRKRFKVGGRFSDFLLVHNLDVRTGAIKP